MCFKILFMYKCTWDKCNNYQTNFFNGVSFLTITISYIIYVLHFGVILCSIPMLIEIVKINKFYNVGKRCSFKSCLSNIYEFILYRHAIKYLDFKIAPIFSESRRVEIIF